MNPISVTPMDETALAAEIRQAYAASVPLEIVGGGTKLGFGNPVAAGKRLGVTGIAGITLYEPAALTVVVKAGTSLSELEAALAAENQRLPFEPADYRALLGTSGEPTIGGTVACGISGSARIQAGSARDSLIGVRFVTGEGEIVKNGGRVMKNVTGYDLVKLICGSFGTLGVLTELSFKLLPRSETTATVVLRGLDDESAIAALSAALTSPFDITGAAHLPDGPDGKPQTLIRVQGFEASVRYRCEKLLALLAEFGKAEIAGADNSASLWLQVRDVSIFAGRQGAVWRVSCKPGDGPKIVAAIRNGGEVSSLYDWGGGLVWLLVPETGDCSAARIRNAVEARGGHATLVRASAETRARIPAFHPQAPAIEAISSRLRRRFDPAGILNPGRMSLKAAEDA